MALVTQSSASNVEVSEGGLRGSDPKCSPLWTGEVSLLWPEIVSLCEKVESKIRHLSLLSANTWRRQSPAKSSFVSLSGRFVSIGISPNVRRNGRDLRDGEEMCAMSKY